MPVVIRLLFSIWSQCFSALFAQCLQILRFFFSAVLRFYKFSIYIGLRSSLFVGLQSWRFSYFDLSGRWSRELPCTYGNIYVTKFIIFNLTVRKTNRLTVLYSSIEVENVQNLKIVLKMSFREKVDHLECFWMDTKYESITKQLWPVS